jgi:uncharacterized protein (DUF1501 family)
VKISVVGTKTSPHTHTSSYKKHSIMPSAADLKKQLEAARLAARRQEEELAKAMAEAEEAERVAAEAEAKRLRRRRLRG